jgi:calcineurin-like phosphoesterase family protein
MAFTVKYYTADTHFGHQLMLSETACARPFANVKEMDETLIRNWNSVVRPDDIVYHLGDFSMGLGDPDRVRSIFNRLMGRKRLVLGNHDFAKANKVHPTIATLDWDEEPTALVETTDEGERLVLCHYALRTWPGVRKGAWHFYGHNHGQMPGIGRSRDVGVDCPDTGFTPRTFRQLTQGMRHIEPVVEKGA